MHQLPDWMYHAIEESFTCRFASTTARDIPVALPVFLNHFDPDTGTLMISSPVAVKRVENVRQRPKVAILFSPVGSGPGEPKHVLLVQGLAEVDETNLMSGWKRYFAGWARRQPSARESLASMEQAMPGYDSYAGLLIQRTDEIAQISDVAPQAGEYPFCQRIGHQNQQTCVRSNLYEKPTCWMRLPSRYGQVI